MNKFRLKIHKEYQVIAQFASPDYKNYIYTDKINLC